jgi:hypothetical protein
MKLFCGSTSNPAPDPWKSDGFAEKQLAWSKGFEQVMEV